MSVFFYLASIVFANVLASIFGIVAIFGISFPAGAVAIGLTFSARDYVQQIYGKLGCWKWMITALIITLFFNLNVAVASGSAFLVAEFIDWIIFTYSNRPFKQRVIISNLISIPIDSVIFVVLAFGWNWDAVWGQTIIKIVFSIIFLFIKNDSKKRIKNDQFECL